MPYTKPHIRTLKFLGNRTSENIIEEDIILQFHKNKDIMKKNYLFYIAQNNRLSEHEKLHHIKFFNTKILPSLLKDKI